MAEKEDAEIVTGPRKVTDLAQSTLYRQNLKLSSKKRYEEYLEKQKERMREYRKQQKNNPEILERNREKAKIRQKKYRERKKIVLGLNKENTNSLETMLKPKLNKMKVTPKTRAVVEQKRTEWREAKRKYRQKLSASKKAWVKRKDRERKKKKTDNLQSYPLETSPDTGFKSKRTLYNVTANARRALPKSPAKFAMVMKNLVKNSSPRKRSSVVALLSPTLEKKQNLEETMDFLEDGHVSQKILPTQTRKNGADGSVEMDAQHISKHSKITQQKLKRNTTMNRKCHFQQKLKRNTTMNRKCHFQYTGINKYRISATTVRKVKNFYLREDISIPLPQKRYTTKHGPCYAMQTTLRAAFRLFTKEHREKIGFTRFTTLRPKNVRLINTITHWNYCVCTTCQNINYKLKALNRCTKKKIADADELLNIILCPKSDGQRFHAPCCIFGDCGRCKDLNLKHKLASYLDADRNDKQEVCWNHWERGTQADGKVRKVLKTKCSNINDFVQELLVDIKQPIQGTSFPEHYFVGRWQQRHFSELKRNLPPDTLLLVMDFAKNRTVRYQDEPKSVYFTAQQITIHPIVTFYNSPETPALITRNSLVFLTDDITHDHHAVDHFFEHAVSHIKDLGITFSRVIVFSDGCASQYKGKGSFADLSLKDTQIERNYFGSDHGKSECDGEIGSINRGVDIAIVGRKAVISNAMDMHTWCMADLSLDEPGSKRTFFHVKQGVIDHDRETSNVNTLKGCRKLHQIMNIPSTRYRLKVKKLSCYCAKCRHNETDLCINKEYTGSFVERSLLPHKVIKITEKGKTNAKATKMTREMPEKNDRENNGKKEGEKPRKKEGEKPGKKGEKPGKKDGERPGKKDGEKPGKKDGEKPGKKEGEKPGKKEGEKPGKKEGEKPGKKEGERPGKKDGEKPGKKDGEKPGKKQGEKPGKKDGEKPGKKDGEKPGKKQGEKPGKKDGEKHGKQEGNEDTLEIASYEDIMKKLGECKTYEELKCVVYYYSKNVTDVEAKLHSSTIIDEKFTVDKIASDLIPPFMNTSSFYPARVIADGNCFPRCISVHMYGNESKHAEMRARIVIELIINEDTYLDYHHLSKGMCILEREARKLTSNYALYSSQYTFGDVLTENTIRRIYQNEVLEVAKMGTYMGIWQMFAAATVMKCTINSVYPERGNPNVRSDLNRKIPPFGHNAELHGTKEVSIMWTSTREDMELTHWVPNHFVPLLPLESPRDIELVEDSYSDDEDTMEISGLSGILEFLQSENIDNSDQLSLLEMSEIQDDVVSMNKAQSIPNLLEEPMKFIETGNHDDTSHIWAPLASVDGESHAHTVPQIDKLDNDIPDEDAGLTCPYSTSNNAEQQTSVPMQEVKMEVCPSPTRLLAWRGPLYGCNSTKKPKTDGTLLKRHFMFYLMTLLGNWKLRTWCGRGVPDSITNLISKDCLNNKMLTV